MLYIDENECTGCEYCVVKLPKVFSMDEKGISVPSSIDGIPQEEIDAVIDNCPALCIYRK
ncbi:MAG: ferredoxin [Leptospirales bacterium]|nr:ferredoxin [Leptospirales bacterium]